MRRPRPDPRSGFTLVEVLIVALVISVLAALVQPRLQRALLKARATEIVGTLDTIKVAVLNYQADHHTWPEDVNRGRIPEGLGPYLPEGVDFTGDDFVIDYDDWSSKSGSNSFVGLTVITDQSELGRELARMLGVNAWTNGSDRFTWVMQWTG